MKNSAKALLFLALVFILGYLDWLTTVVGLLYYGGNELNPVLSGLTKSSILVFSAAKLTAVALAGFTAYIATDITKSAKNNWRFTNKFVNCGISFTVIALSVVVANNMIVIFKL
jgi:Domain of unknown function (DUF5658)